MQSNILSDYKEKEWLPQLFTQAPVAIGIYIGKNLVIEFANPKMLHIWDRSWEEVKNRALFEALPEVAGQGFEEVLSGVMDSGEPFSGNDLPATLLRNGKLDLAYFNIVYQPLRNEEGVIYGIIQTATEVTELVESRNKAERNEELLTAALEGGKMGVWSIDFLNGTHTRSVEHDRIYGYQEAVPEWNHEIFLSHVHPDDRAIAEEKYLGGQENRLVDFELRILWSDKSIHWIHIKGRTYYNLKGQPISMSGVVMDVTDRKQAEEQEKQMIAEQAAREETERQRKMLYNLFMNAPCIMVTLKGPEFIFELVNPMYQELFPGRALQGKKILDALPEVKDQPILEILKGVYQTGESYVGTEVPVMLDRFDTGNLEPVYFNFIYQPMRISSGEVKGIFVLGYEITEQFLARKKIEASEENLKIALEAGKMGTWHLDLVNNTSTRSFQHDQIFGYKEPVADWGYNTFIGHILPEDQEMVSARFNKAYKEGNLYVEARILTTDGEKKWIVVKGKTFFQDGKPFKMAGVVMDITERREAEEQLKQLTEKLEVSNRELKAANEDIEAHLAKLSQTNKRLTQINSDLDNFIYTASHDLKAPISNIEGLMKVLSFHLPEDVQSKEVIRKTLGMIKKSVTRFQHTILDLTDIARLQKEVDDASTIKLQDIIQEVKLDMELLIKSSKAQIKVEIQDCEQIKFSYKNLKSVIYNLLSNAIKYRSAKRVPEIFISCSKEAGYLLLFVKDNGLGIKENKIDKIFQMFTRLHTHEEGTGVGLYLVKRIVENAGGRIEVDSTEGEGSVFKVYIPF